MTTTKTTSHRSLSRFVLRTPMLPFDVLTGWAELPDAAARRAALRALVNDPAIREALYVASPELEAQIPAWEREPETPSGVAVERGLVRYISRMASRSTPFGLFAAVSVGAVGGATTQLAIPPRAAANRRTRLDNDLLFALCSDLLRDPEVRARLRYRPNTSLYTAAGRVRYAEARLSGPTRTYHLVAVDRTSYLDALLERAAAGATRDELADVLCTDPDIARDEAAAFIDEVIDAQILVPELAPTVTGSEPTESIIATLAARGLDRYADALRAAWDALRAIDSAAPGVAADAYRAIEKQLAAALPTKVEANRLFQVDTFKPAPEAVLGDTVAADIARAIELLHSLTPSAHDPEWARFRERFVARYETREVPLVEVLDDEIGIGFGDGSAAAAAPLLEGLAFATRSSTRQTPLRPRDVYLMTLVAEALRTGATEIDLSDEDLEKLREPDPVPLPNLLAAQTFIAAASPEAAAAGDYLLRIGSVGRGANILGRFCHGSADVKSLTEECLRAEEAARPDAIFAEIVHLPEGRLGNVLLRPVLRAYEIPYLGASGAPAENQITVDDLLVSVVGDRVVLRSKRLGREVVPRMTTAHNYTGRSLAVYRFLCSHAHQGIGFAFWSWGLAEQLPILPRIRRGKVVLERARWALSKRDLAPLEAAFEGVNAAKTPEQIRAIRTRAARVIAELRTRLRLPRWIVIGDGDNELPVDLDNELMVDSAAHLLKGRTTATVFELLPAPDQLCARGPEGAFAHELVVMLTGAPARELAPPATVHALPPVSRRFHPGSSWLYLKLYTGHATADALLRDYLAPAIRTARAQGMAQTWFFLRYGDPDWHVRLRFSGDPKQLSGELLPFLYEALAPASERGLVWRIAVDTYEREVERYGGPHGIGVAEHLFWVDSECALSIVENLEGDAGASAAWRLTLRGIDRMLDDLGLSIHAKLAIMTAARDGFGAEVGMDTALQKRLGEKYRAHRAEIAELLAARDDDDAHAYSPALQAFARRSGELRAVGTHLAELERAGHLTQPVADLVHSYVHMHVNRMIRSAQRHHELVLYDLLRRHYDGVIARERQQLKRSA